MLFSFLYLLLAFIPVLMYIGVIWSTTPVGSINIRTSLIHFFTGIISTGLLFTYFKIFPNSHNVMTHLSSALFIFSFIQVALVEEISKFISFTLAEQLRGEDNVFYDKPISTMFYSGISALGFSFIENVIYAMHYGGDVLVVRSFVAMLLHFICGLIIGYWIAASRIPSRLKDKSPFEIFILDKPNLKKSIYIVVGIFCAVFIHGLYDYNLFTEGHITSNYLIIFSGIIATYLAAKDLIIKSKIQ